MNQFFKKELIFEKDCIKINQNNQSTIMMDWERPLMKAHVDITCHNRGDVLEVGFGMGISADYIQEYKPASHTIIEGHPQILEKLYLWSKDKPNIKILEGDWIDLIDKLESYDGIFFDTCEERNYDKLYDTFYPRLKKNGVLTFFNPYQLEKNSLERDCEYLKINVPNIKRMYLKESYYYVPIFKK